MDFQSFADYNSLFWPAGAARASTRLGAAWLVGHSVPPAVLPARCPRPPTGMFHDWCYHHNPITYGKTREDCDLWL